MNTIKIAQLLADRERFNAKIDHEIRQALGVVPEGKTVGMSNDDSFQSPVLPPCVPPENGFYQLRGDVKNMQVEVTGYSSSQMAVLINYPKGDKMFEFTLPIEVFNELFQ